jgi:hypothetical protein
MLKILLSTFVLVGVVFALDGESVYKDKCMSCHNLKGMMDMSQMKVMRKQMKNASQEERQAMKKKMSEKMQESGMKAPAMEMVSLRIKKMTTSKAEFLDFVKDYIQYPAQIKGFCMPRAYAKFGVMPPIGKAMSAEEREVVALWLYTNFKGSWDSSKDAAACSKNNGARAKRKAQANK